MKSSHVRLAAWIAAIAVGEFGTVLITQDAGKTWAVQPNITGKVLQTIVYRG